MRSTIQFTILLFLAQTSVATDLTHVVRIAHAVCADPLNPRLQQDRVSAVAFVQSARDLHVTYCPAIMGPLSGTDYEYANALRDVNVLAQAAFAIEHPDRATDLAAVYAAASSAVSCAYDAILAAHPDARFAALDELRRAPRTVMGKCGRDVVVLDQTIWRTSCTAH